MDLEKYDVRAARVETIKSVTAISEAIERLDIYGDIEPTDDEYANIHARLVLDYQESGKQKRSGKTDQEVSDGQEFYLDQLISYCNKSEDELFDFIYKRELFDNADDSKLSEISSESSNKITSRKKRPKKKAA